MTSLESFLKNNKDKNVSYSEPASGSFQCQDLDCNEVVNDGYIDRVHSRLHWTCPAGHDSSVVI
jgi:hypothetical protein